MKEKLGQYFGISLWIFLFILFFQPFSISFQNESDKLIFTAGFGAIVFLILIVSRIILYTNTQKNILSEQNGVLSYYHMAAVLVLSSIAFAFYLRYVGQSGISFHIMLKIVITNFTATAILRYYHLKDQFRLENKALIKEYTELKQQFDKTEENILKKTIELISESHSDNIKFELAQIHFIKSADNYVEIYYTEDEHLKKKLVRNTLKNIELQLSPYQNFIRCHRTVIVNTNYISKIFRKLNNYQISLKNTGEQLPVSRQYLFLLKEYISKA